MNDLNDLLLPDWAYDLLVAIAIKKMRFKQGPASSGTYYATSGQVFVFGGYHRAFREFFC
jgi:hypothetical protein